MQEKTTLAKLEDRIPYWGLPAAAMVVGVILWILNDVIRPFVAQHWNVPISTVPNYQPIGIVVAAGGIILFLRRRRYF